MLLLPLDAWMAVEFACVHPSVCICCCAAAGAKQVMQLAQQLYEAGE